ncbi:MAG: hypothetical protein ACR2KB_00775 [Chitinophagaceae bacterium]
MKSLNHQYLPFPFVNNCTIEIKNAEKTKQLTCELATSAVEIFQSLNFRKSKDFTIPLVLKFPHHHVPSIVLSNYAFAVEHACVDEHNKVVNVYVQQPKKNTAPFVQAVAYKLVILAPPGFADKHKITNKSTLIIQP